MNEIIKHLIKLIKEKAIFEGQFVLKSGIKSSYYLDLRKITLLSGGSIFIAMALRNALKNIEFQAIGGPTLGADPIVSSYLNFIGTEGFVNPHHFNLRGFLVRKEEKTYGNKDLIVGSVQKGDKVVVVEDVTSTGSDLIRSIKAIVDYGCEVVAAICVLDRMGGTNKILKKMGIKFISLININDLGLPVDYCINCYEKFGLDFLIESPEYPKYANRICLDCLKG